MCSPLPMAHSEAGQRGASRSRYPHTRAGTHPVAKKQPNEWGLYDMLGNVWEWCADCWHGSYERAPSDGSAGTEGAGGGRVLRGGSWFDFARLVRSASRDTYDLGYRYYDIGFRCARVQAGREPSKGPKAQKTGTRRRGRKPAA